MILIGFTVSFRITISIKIIIQIQSFFINKFTKEVISFKIDFKYFKN